VYRQALSITESTLTSREERLTRTVMSFSVAGDESQPLEELPQPATCNRRLFSSGKP